MSATSLATAPPPCCEAMADTLPKRPRTRADCIDGLRPCPWIECRHHLFIDVAPRDLGVWKPDGAWRAEKLDPRRRRGSHVLRTVDDDTFVDILLSMENTCVLDLVVSGGITLEETGDTFGITRERARQIEKRALEKILVRTRVGGGDAARFAEALDLLLKRRST